MADIDALNVDKTFDLDAGILCLDFANTANWHASAHPEEGLQDYRDLVAWGTATGLLIRQEASSLLARAEAHPEEAEKWLAEAIHLREAVYRIFTAVSHRDEAVEPEQADLDILNRFWRQGAQYRRLVASGGQLLWRWELRSDDPLRMVWPAAQSAVDLLESDQRSRVGQCEDDRGCGWLFLDTSRNRSRRWCSMESCGNRAKAIRHYARAKT